MKKILVAVLAMIFVIGSFSMTTQASGTGNVTVFVNPGDSVSGATVSVTVNGQVQTAVSNYMGIANFSNIPAGTYKFTVSKAGYSDGTGTFTISAGSNTVTLKLGAQPGNANITVIDQSTNRPVSGVQVSISGNGVQTYVNTNANGVAAFSNIQNGTYKFTALASGYNQSTASVTIPANGTAAYTMALAPLAATQGKTGDITIFVNPGNSVSGAAVSFTANGKLQTGQTNGMGQTKFSNIPTGTYTFKASAAGYYDGTASITVYDGSANTGSIYMTAQTGNAKITVLDKITNKPISGVQITISRNGVQKYVITDAKGMASFADIQVGSYIFAALKGGYQDASVNATVPLNGTATGTVTMNPQISAKLHFNPLPNGINYVSGYIKSVDGGSEYQSIRTVASDQTVTLYAGKYQFYAKWADKNGHNRTSKSDIITITQSGTYTVNPVASPSNDF